MASLSKDTWWRNNGILNCPLTNRSRKCPSVEENRSYVAIAICMYALACLWDGTPSAFHTPKLENSR